MKNVYGYARVSTVSQSYDSQVDAIKEYCRIKDYNLLNIFSDKVSGKTTDRPGFQKLQEVLRRNPAGAEAVVITKIDRCARNLRDLLNFVEYLSEHKVDFVSIDNQIDTTTPQGRLFLQLFGMISEFERALIVERTREGYSRYRATGGKVGKPKIDIDMDEVRRQLVAGVPKTRIAKRMRIGIQTLYNRLNEKP